MHLSVILQASLIYLPSLAQAIPNALGTSTHDSPFLKVRKELYLPSPPRSPPQFSTSAPPRVGRSSPLTPQHWQRILAQLRDRTGGPLIDGTGREGRPRPRVTSASTGNLYIGLTRVLRVRPQPHSPQSRSPSRPHLKPRAPKNEDPLPPTTPPSRNSSRINSADPPAHAPYVLRPPFPSHTPLPGRITLQPTTSVDQEFWRYPGPFQQNALAPRIDVPQVPSFLRDQNPPPAAGRDHAPLTPSRAHQGARGSQNPNPNPSAVPAFNPIDHAAAEFPLLHSRSAKPWTSMANIPELAPAEHVPLPRIDAPIAPDTLRQRYSCPTPPAAGQHHAPSPPTRTHHPANRLLNPTGLPAFNPIDAPAAEYPLLHARAPKEFVLTSPRTPSTAIIQEQAPVPGPPLAPQSPRESPSQHSHSRSRSSRSSSSHSSSNSSILSDSESGASSSDGSISTDSTQMFNVITCLPHPRQGVRCEQHCECDRHLTVNCSRYMRRCPRLCHCTYSEE